MKILREIFILIIHSFLQSSNRTLLSAIIISLTPILASCASEKLSGENVITADLGNETEVSIFDVFEEIHVVSLFTDKNHFISQISQIEYFEQRFYVFDQTLQSLYCFNIAGEIIMKISMQGNGPGEYRYATNFTIDQFNREILFLSPSFAQITAFNMEGDFVGQNTIKEVFGYNYITALNDSVLLLTSRNEYQSLFFCRNSQEIFKKEFGLPNEALHHLAPGEGNFYRFKDRVYVIPALELTIKDITEIKPISHLHFAFGDYDNSTQQYNQFLKESEILPHGGVLRMHQIVGKGKLLNSHLLKVAEVDRFVLALVVCDNTVKHLIYDKHNDKAMIFNLFTENVAINPMFTIAENYLIAFETRNYSKQRALEFYQNLFPYFDANWYCLDNLSEKCRNIIENHDPMTDNPYLVVYKFKE
jgi:hypothetical protein